MSAKRKGIVWADFKFGPINLWVMPPLTCTFKLQRKQGKVQSKQGVVDKLYLQRRIN